MDWIGSIGLLTGTLLLTQKVRWGWIFNIVGSAALVINLWHSWPLVILQTVFIILAFRGFVKWTKDS